MIHPDTEIELYLIRHAQSEMNLNPHIIGGRSASTPLSQLGGKQSEALRYFLRNQGIAFNDVYSSPFNRAVSTAEISLGLDNPIIHFDDRLVEYSAGEWEGQERSKIQTPDVLFQMAEMGIDFRPPGGESQRDVMLRAAKWLQETIIGNEEILQSGKKLKIAAYTHGLTIKCLLRHILGFDSHLIWRLEIDNCGISKLVFNARGWWPKYINRVPY